MSSKPSVDLQFGDGVAYMKTLPSGSVDVVLTDPPYGYLKHKLDRPFDEPEYFNQVNRILKDSGFHVTFGRGTSFYGWNVQLADRGFAFKEEVIWNKKNSSGPSMKLQRFHETVSIYAKKKGVIRESLIPYLEMRGADFARIQDDLARIRASLGTEAGTKELREFVEEYLETGKIPEPVYREGMKTKHGITVGKGMKGAESRTIKNFKPLLRGMLERSIIDVTRDHYTSEHPTQKPVRLMERLMLLVSDPGMTVLDPFMGSGSTGLAAYVQGRNFIGCEILPEYFAIASRRMREMMSRPIEEMAWCC